MKKWIIYKIMSPSGNIYIGVTCNFNKRMGSYKHSDKNKLKQPLLQNSFDKYGFFYHQIEIIDEIYGNINEAHSKEMFWIRTYMSNRIKYRDRNGLNLTDGGQGTIGWKASPEHRKKLSEIHKSNPSRGRLGKKLSEEAKQRLREVRKLQKNISGWKWTEAQKINASVIRKGKPVYKNRGRITPIETRRKQSLAKLGKTPWNKGIKTGQQPPNCKKVLRFDKFNQLIGCYKSISEASIKSGFTKDIIRRMINNEKTLKYKTYFKLT